MTVLVATDIGLFCMASFQELDLVVGVELVDEGFDESAWTLKQLEIRLAAEKQSRDKRDAYIYTEYLRCGAKTVIAERLARQFDVTPSHIEVIVRRIRRSNDD